MIADWLLIAIVFGIVCAYWALVNFTLSHIARGIQGWLADERRIWP